MTALRVSFSMSLARLRHWPNQAKVHSTTQCFRQRPKAFA